MSLFDVDHFWSNDVAPSPTGDLGSVSGISLGQQRILRRLLTNPGDYLFQPDYGAGLPQFVGLPMDIGRIVGAIRSQLLLESTVARTPEPTIKVSQVASDLTALNVTIRYTDAPSSAPSVLSFNVAG